MPWKDDSKSSEPGSRAGSKLGPWDAPGAAVAPPPKTAKPRPWDDSEPAVEPPAKRPRLAPLRRPRSPDERTGAAPPQRPRVKAQPRRPAAKPEAPRRRGPDLGALRRRLGQSLADRFAGARGRRLRVAMATGLLAGMAVGWALSGVYRVAADQIGVVERFGVLTAQAGPGVHYHLPWPVGAVRLLPVGAPRADGGDAELDASDRMLAAGGAPVQVSYSLSWRVSDPPRYLSRMAYAPQLLSQFGDAAVRRAVGAAPLNGLLSRDQGAVGAAATSSLQDALDRLGAGIKVAAVDIRGVDPAEAAEAAARDYAAALQDAHGEALDVAAYRDRIVAQARGDAAKALQDARGVADQEVAEAKGEAARFDALDAAYRQAPDATRERLYTEAMERVMKAANKVVVDAPKGSTIVLPGSAVPRRGADAAAAAAPGQPATSPVAPPATGQNSSGDAT